MKKILLFTTAWCGPCKTMKATIEKVKSELPKDLVIEEVDAEKNRDIANKYCVSGIPMLIFLKHEQKICHLIGAVKAEELIEKIRQVY